MDLLQNLMEVTDGGLTIIQFYYPDARPGKQFKKRSDEKTASASLKKLADGNYVLTDFGDSGAKPKNAVMIAAEEENLDWTKALMLWASKYNLLQNYEAAKADFKTPRPSDIDYEFEYNRKTTHYHIQQKANMTPTELKVLGPHVTEAICKELNIYAIEYYSSIKDGKITEIHSNENYPIFGIFNKEKDEKGNTYEWVKILQPKSYDKSYRFFYINGRPENFIHGYTRARKLYDKLNVEEIKEDNSSENDESEASPKIEKKLTRIVICSGDRDAINMASIGETVVWMNSETADLKAKIFKKFKDIAYSVVNVPDLDSTGKFQGKKHALDNIELKTAWLPKELSAKVDWRGNPQKDFTDYCGNYKEAYQKETLTTRVKLMLENAYQAQFWSIKHNKEGVPSYHSSLRNLFYFLELNGFYRVEDPENENGYQYIHLQNHLVETVTVDKIRDFVLNYLETKREFLGDRIIPIGLLNLFYTPGKLSETVFQSLEILEFKPSKPTASNDYFYFKDQIWEIKNDGIQKLDTKKFTTHIWSQNIVENQIENLYDIRLNPKNIKINQPYFNISKKGTDYDIEILKNDCDFLNYTINLSRVYWKNEFKDMSATQRDEHYKNNKFCIDSSNLTDEEVAEQKLHLINKIYTMGYMLHRYKASNRSWVVIMMDNEVVSLDESHGGTGKSIFTNAPRIFLNQKFIPARSPRLFENDFYFTGVTKYTDYVLFDDADANFKFTEIYSHITGDFAVNPKGKTPYVIPFRNAPKIVVSTNFTIKNQDPSTARRILETAASNWYHHATESMENHNPEIEFGYELFKGWDDNQWNHFFNFSAQCLQFYLSCNEKISAPNSQVKLRQQLSIMGTTFHEWANREFPQYINNIIDKNLGKNIMKDTLWEQFKSKENQKSISAALFTKKVKAWCIYNNIELNPAPIRQSDGRWMRKISGTNCEYYYFYQDPALQNNEIEFDDAGDWIDNTDDLPYSK